MGRRGRRARVGSLPFSTQRGPALASPLAGTTASANNRVKWCKWVSGLGLGISNLCRRPWQGSSRRSSSVSPQTQTEFLNYFHHFSRYPVSLPHGIVEPRLVLNHPSSPATRGRVFLSVLSTMTGTPSTRLSTSPPPPPDSPIRNSFLSPPRRKERRNPSVTPRRFARFFRTPLGEGSSQYGFEGGYAGGGRVALSDVGGSTTNSQPTRVKRKLFDNEDSTSAPLLPPPEPLTKRTRTEPDTHPFSDENIPALSHRLDTRGFVEVCRVSRTTICAQ